MDIAPALLRDMYRMMLLARRFDEAQIQFYKSGKEKMESVHSYIGQEAIGIGVGCAMRQGDYLLPSLRSRPAFFARGVPVQTQWAGVLGRADSPGMGLTGSRHMAALQHGIVGTTGILGAHVPVATGVGLALRLLKRGGAAVCLFGDGAANRGDVHEGMNMASLFKSPVVFVCESNGVAESQEWDSYMPIEDISVRASGYGMPGLRVDGNDVCAVYAATLKALERAREQQGPSFIVADTCRLHPHVEGLPDFRSAEYMQAWRERDPVRRTREQLIAMGALTEEQAEDMTTAVDADIAQALEMARAGASLGVDNLADLVFARGEGEA